MAFLIKLIITVFSFLLLFNEEVWDGDLYIPVLFLAVGLACVFSIANDIDTYAHLSIYSDKDINPYTPTTFSFFDDSRTTYHYARSNTPDNSDIKKILKYYNIEEKEEKVPAKVEVESYPPPLPTTHTASTTPQPSNLRKMVYDSIIGCIENKVYEDADVVRLLKSIKSINIRLPKIEISYDPTETSELSVQMPIAEITRLLAFCYNEPTDVKFIKTARPSLMDYYENYKNKK